MKFASAKFAVLKPIEDGGRMAIIIYNRNDSNDSQELKEYWTTLLSDIEKDFFIARIAPRPLTTQNKSCAIVNDNKFPGSLYTYYKCDDCQWNNESGPYEGVTIKGLEELINTQRKSEIINALFKIMKLEGIEGARLIQNDDKIRRNFKTVEENISSVLMATSPEVNNTPLLLSVGAVLGGIALALLIFSGVITTFAVCGYVCAALLIIVGLATIIHQCFCKNNGSDQQVTFSM